MTRGQDGLSRNETLEEAGVVRRRRTRPPWSVGRIILNFVVLAAFVGAVWALYALIQGSGVLDGADKPAPVSFEDVPEEYAQSVRIYEAVEKGLVRPATPTRFGPGDEVTRGEFAEVVVRTMGWEAAPDEAEAFGDVEGDPGLTDEADYIAVVATKGVMGGGGGDPPSFAPAEAVQLRHVLVVLARAAGDALPEPASIDPDIQALSVSDEIQTSYQRLRTAGVLEGVTLDPSDEDLTGTADREQVAVAAVNLHRLLGGD